jgi:hypothetical protein
LKHLGENTSGNNDNKQKQFFCSLCVQKKWTGIPIIAVIVTISSISLPSQVAHSCGQTFNMQSQHQN